MHRSSWLDRLLVFLLVFSIYFEANLPYIGTASTPFVIFGITLVYIGITRLKTLLRLFSSRYFIAVAGFALLCVFMETIHPFPSYDTIFRFVNMSLGIFCIAVLCRDARSFDLALFTFVLASALQSIILIAGTLDILRSFSAEGFYDATRVRLMAFEEFFLRGNLNELSYFSSIGAIIGVIWSYYEKRKGVRMLLLALTIPSILGVFLPASRTGAVIFFLSLLVFIYKSGVNLKRWILPALILSLFLVITVPEVVWVRLGSLMKISELQEEDSRTRVYLAVLRNMDDYLLTGVGAGNYWHGWAVDAGITNRHTTDLPSAAHNAFFQVWIFWGLPALLAFIYLIYEFSRAIENDISGNRRKACLFIFMMMIPVIFLFYHSFYHKTFSIGVGMLLAARFWDVFDESAEGGMSPK